MNNTWTEEEVLILSNSYTETPKEDMLTLLEKRSWEAIRKKAKTIGLSKNKSESVSYRTKDKNKISNIEKYRTRYGIVMDEDKYWDTFSLIEWFLLSKEGKIFSLPRVFQTKENWIEIIRYCLKVDGLLNNRKEILLIDSNYFDANKLSGVYKYISSKMYEVLQNSVPEMDLKAWEFKNTSGNYFKDRDNVIEAIDWILSKYDFEIGHFYHNTDFQLDRFFIDNGLSKIYTNFSNSVITMLDWYCGEKGINLTMHNRVKKPNNYWKDINNFNLQFKMYIDPIKIKYPSEKEFINDLKTILTFEQLSLDVGNYLYPSMKKYNHYGSLYEAFMCIYPEYDLTLNDFKFVGSDGVSILDSYREKIIFDYIYNELNIKNVKAIGRKRSDGFYNETHRETYFPDFIIEDILDKPIIIEYYGFYDKKIKNNEFVKGYNDKTHRKNNFYRNSKSIYFIDIYPNDLNNKNRINNKFKQLLA